MWLSCFLCTSFQSFTDAVEKDQCCDNGQSGYDELHYSLSLNSLYVLSVLNLGKLLLLRFESLRRSRLENPQPTEHLSAIFGYPVSLG